MRSQSKGKVENGVHPQGKLVQPTLLLLRDTELTCFTLHAECIYFGRTGSSIRVRLRQLV